MQIIKILLVEPSESIGEVITKSLRRAFNAEVFFFKTAAEGIDCLKNDVSFSLILVRNRSLETTDHVVDQIAEQFLNIIYDLSIQIPMIVIGEFEHTYKKYALVSENLRIEEINRLVLKALGLKKENFEHLKLPEFVPFPVKHFYLMNNSPCGIYIKLLKKSGDEFVMRLKKGDLFNKADLLKYEELGLVDFYIAKDEYEIFMNELFVQTLNFLKIPRKLEENIEILGDTFVLGTDLLRSLGINTNSIAVVDQTIAMIKNQIQKTDQLGILFKRLLDNKLSYAYRQSYLISLLGQTLLPNMQWGGGDQQNILLEKICMVSYFHDIYLEEENLIKIFSIEDLKNAKLTVLQIELVNNHANRAALLVQSYPKLHQGIDLIIKQHHGVSNGVGFPLVLTSAISPLAIFFIVVEDFATQILALTETNLNLAISMKAALINLKEKYQLPSYRKVVIEIENMLYKKK